MASCKLVCIFILAATLAVGPCSARSLPDDALLGSEVFANHNSQDSFMQKASSAGQEIRGFISHWAGSTARRLLANPNANPNSNNGTHPGNKPSPSNPVPAPSPRPTPNPRPSPSPRPSPNPFTLNKLL